MYLIILMSETCQGFFNIEDFYRSCNYDCLWWIFLDIKTVWCTHQNLHMTFKNILGFLQNLSTSWKSCVNEQWPKKSLFKKLTQCHDLWLKAKKRVKYIWVPEIMIDELVHIGQTKLYMFSVFSERFKVLHFRPFLDTNSYLRTKPYNFD